MSSKSQDQTDKVLTIETELNCPECGLIAVSTFEVVQVGDGKGYVVCYECGERNLVEVA